MSRSSITTLQAIIRLAGHGDPDWDDLRYSWSAGGLKISGRSIAWPIAHFPVSATTVKLVVADEAGETSSDTVRVTVRRR